MSEQDSNAFEMRSRALFHDSVDGLDMRIRSRLTQARSAALEAAAVQAAAADRRPWTFSWKMWTPAFGVTAAAILGFALWTGSPPDTQSNFEDLDLVAATDEGSADAMEMLQDDIDFYDFADKAANSGPAA
jgi:hypothetical protein